MALPQQTSSLSATQAEHLLRRATFGTSNEQIKAFTGKKPVDAVNILLAGAWNPPAPVGINGTFHDKPHAGNDEWKNINALKQWWIANMAAQPLALPEKMNLFWQNQFVSTASVIYDARFLYRYYALIDKHALGNYRQLVIDMTKEPIMLRYLNGNVNVNGKPNENYARELQELFTIGAIKPDGTPNYTEDDVKAAARVLTGWTDFGYGDTKTANIGSTFNPTKHDIADKKFSALYQNTIIKSKTVTVNKALQADPTTGDYELGLLVDMILKQAETAKKVCRELYRWFVDAEITATIEKNIIEPLADTFRKGNYEIKPVMAELLTSKHFFTTDMMGAMVKSPLEFLIGLFKNFNQTIPNITTASADFYALGNYIHIQSGMQQQSVLDQPNVFGWPAYYAPGFYEIWVNSNTLPMRGNITDNFVKGYIKNGTVKYGFDSVELAKTTSKPSDAKTLVIDLCASLFPITLPNNQIDFLIDSVLLPANLPRDEWTDEWLDYMAKPTDTKKKNLVKMKLDSLFLYLLRMAEYQLN